MLLQIRIDKNILENLNIKKTGLFTLLGRAIAKYPEEYKILNDIINLRNNSNLKNLSARILKDAFFHEKDTKKTTININQKKAEIINGMIGNKNFIEELIINQPMRTRGYVFEETLKLYKGEDNAILEIKKELEKLKQEQENSNNSEPNKTKEEPVKEKPEEKKSDGGIDLSNIIVF